MSKSSKKEWGGPWTNQKLNAFENYVKSYLTILNKQPRWGKIYFDGFAGDGQGKKIKSEIPLFQSITQEEQFVYRGAAERIVSLKAPFNFDYYYFIELSQQRLQSLETKLSQINNDEQKKLIFRATDCNKELLKLANVLKKHQHVALILLDPFGMHINWKSIERFSNTRSDIWLLLPTAVIVNRLLDKKGLLKNIKKLESFFGMKEDQIRKEFYIQTGQGNFFSTNTEVKKIVDPIDKISSLYIKRLKSVWKHVTEPALRLDNNSGAPLFHFIFASNNKTAHKIANYIIQNS
ncbi:three-Cys-motif partner protein TcmP [Gracilimonas tropica]|uniref:three-Cys-motif partner protein TcmP n=1 Tax=Gracilimonas tropica TaxID=454600 RepID=UPI00035E425E|nr:three-Cys-motif partner protein TcmP [Gracilimonas tropica]